MKSLVWSTYGYDLTWVFCFQVILFIRLKTIIHFSFFYKNENSTLFKSSTFHQSHGDLCTVLSYVCCQECLF